MAGKQLPKICRITDGHTGVLRHKDGVACVSSGASIALALSVGVSFETVLRLGVAMSICPSWRSPVA